VLRLDTRHDLVKSRRLHAALSYEEVPTFNHGQYFGHWLAKPLAWWPLAQRRHLVCRSLRNDEEHLCARVGTASARARGPFRNRDGGRSMPHSVGGYGGGDASLISLTRLTVAWGLSRA
jgi:hypothetical protein